VVRSTWAEFSAGRPADEIAMLSAFREFTGSLEGTEEQVHVTEIRFIRKRVFATAFILSHRLELAIDLLRTASHPRLLQAFHTTKKVVTHRLSLERLEQFDDSVKELIVEAHETVGPGTR
jgi:hypothetical protein